VVIDQLWILLSYLRQSICFPGSLITLTIMYLRVYYLTSHQMARLIKERVFVTGLFLSNENTIGPAIDLLALVLREASRDRR